MRQHEGSLVLHVQITRQLQGRQALHGIAVDGNGGQVDLQRQLVAGEDRAGRDRERVVAVAAALLAAGLDEVVLGDAAAARADRVVMAPTALLEHLESLIVVERKNLAQRQGASLGGEQEVLSHDHSLNINICVNCGKNHHRSQAELQIILLFKNINLFFVSIN